jgi:predicted PurR-regulated permease PerM
MVVIPGGHVTILLGSPARTELRTPAAAGKSFKRAMAELQPLPPPGEPNPSAFKQSTAHVRTAGTALFNWGRAVLIEGLCLAVLWWIGLLILHVPLAAIWALIAGLMAVIPNFGGVIALIGPALSILFTGHDMERLAFLLGLYAVIVVIDQLLVQPLVMKKVTRVPIWASLLVPILLGILIPFWGVLLAPPLLAVLYAFRRPCKSGSA